MEILLLVVAVLALVGGSLMGWVAFGRTNTLARRLEAAEAEIRRLTAGLGPAPSAAAAAADGDLPDAPPGFAWRPDERGVPVLRPLDAPPPATPDAAQDAAAAPAEPPSPAGSAPAGSAPADDDPAAAPPTDRAAAPPRPRGDLESALGARWAVWVGGLALGLGGIFLVRTGIEAGLLGPGARVLLALVFAAVLLGAGEALRRRDPDAAGGALRRAYLPGVVTAAGSVAAFAAVYAAYALYGFVGPAAAFLALGLVALATLALSVLHGPGLAGLGLAAGYGTPLLVSSDAPSYGALVLYLQVLTVSTLAVARIRGWRWLAVTAVVGSGLWAALMTVATTEPRLEAVIVAVHVALTAALAVAVFAASVHPRDPGRADRHDPVGALMPVVAALPALVHVAGFGDTAAGLALVLGLGAALALAAYEWPAVRLAGLGAVAIVPLGIAGLALPVIRPMLETGAVLAVPEVDGGRTVALSLGTALLFAGIGLVGTAGSAARVVLAVVGTAVPVLAGVVAYLRLAGWTESLPFGVAFLVLAGFLGAATGALARRLDRTEFGTDGAVAVYAVGTVAALGCAFTAVLERGFLTVALALLAPAIAWVESRRPVPGLRPVAAAAAAVVALRLFAEPTVVGPDVGMAPVFNWLLWGYGGPAAAFAFTAWRMARTRDDRLFVPLFEALAVAGTALAAAMVIHHAMAGGVDAPVSGLAETALLALTMLSLSLGLQWLAARRPSPVFSGGTLVLGGIGLALSAFGLLVAQNPVVTGEPVDGGAFSGVLLLGYLVPALFTLAVAAVAARRPDRPRAYVALAAAVGGALAFAWLTLSVRAGWHAGDLSLDGVEETELYAYSAVWLLAGLALLAAGLVTRVKALRAVAAALIALVVAKLFLVDTASLGGALRAASFIGTGAVLILIGFAYQRLARRFDAAG